MTRRLASPEFVLSEPYLSPRRWAKRAMCTEERLGIPLSEIDRLFFPGRGETSATASMICRACPVRAVCLEWALASQAAHGVFGGLGPAQRQRHQSATDGPGVTS